MKKCSFIVFAFGIALSGCSKDKESHCGSKLVGTYTATTYQKGVADETMAVTVTPRNNDRLLFCTADTDDTIEAIINCDRSTLVFPGQANLPGLVRGNGSFDLSTRNISFYLLTRDEGITDSVSYVLTMP